MVYINSWGPAKEPFTGAYIKRLERNRNRAAAEADQTERKDALAARDVLGGTVEISEESREFLAGAAERKAAQLAEMEAAGAEMGGNVFNGTGDFRKQYLVLSENLYNNGFYEELSDEEVRDMEEMLQDITAGMESINGNGFNRNYSTDMSHEAARLELISSVNALNYFADTYVPEGMRDSFKEMIEQYESYNRERVEAHRNIYDLRDESLSGLSAPNAVFVSAAVRKSQEESRASAEIGRVSHTREQEQENNRAYQALFDRLVRGQDSVGNIFDSLRSTLVDYASGGSRNSVVRAMLDSRNTAAIHHMADYWARLRTGGKTEEASVGMRSAQVSENRMEPGKTSGIGLSSAAQKLLDELSGKYSNMDFLVADFAGGEDARTIMSKGTKEFSVLFTPEDLEKMASDEKYREERIRGIEGAVRMSDEINKKYGFQPAFGKSNGYAEISRIGIFFDADGIISLLTGLEKSGASQRERLEK